MCLSFLNELIVWYIPFVGRNDTFIVKQWLFMGDRKRKKTGRLIHKLKRYLAALIRNYSVAAK